MSEERVRSFDLLFERDDVVSFYFVFGWFVTYLDRLPELPFLPLVSLLPLSLFYVVFLSVFVEL